MSKTVASVMSSDPYVVSKHASVVDAAAIMRDRNIGSVPVVDNGYLLGIVTDRDLAVRVIAEGLDPRTTKVEQVATANIHSASPDDSLDEVYERMAIWRIRRLRSSRPTAGWSGCSRRRTSSTSSRTRRPASSSRRSRSRATRSTAARRSGSAELQPASREAERLPATRSSCGEMSRPPSVGRTAMTTTTTTPARALRRRRRPRARDRRHLRGAEPVRRRARRRRSTAPGRPRSRRRSRVPCARSRSTRKLPAWRRAEVLGADRRRRSRPRREDFARTIALEAGKPIKAARDRGGARARSRSASRRRRRSASTARSCQLDWLPGTEGRTGHVRRVPLGPIAGHLAVQLPAQPRRAQGRARARGRQPDRAAAREPDADQRAQAGADRARGRLARGGDRGRAVDDGRRRAARRGRADQAADVHRQPGGRLGAEEPRRHEARDARARRQRRGRRRTPTPTPTTPPSASSGAAPTNAGPDLHLGAARLPPRVARGLRGRPRAAVRARSSSATRSTRRRTSAR